MRDKKLAKGDRVSVLQNEVMALTDRDGFPTAQVHLTLSCMLKMVTMVTSC